MSSETLEERFHADLAAYAKANPDSLDDDGNLLPPSQDEFSLEWAWKQLRKAESELSRLQQENERLLEIEKMHELLKKDYAYIYGKRESAERELKALQNKWGERLDRVVAALEPERWLTKTDDEAVNEVVVKIGELKALREQMRDGAYHPPASDASSGTPESVQRPFDSREVKAALYPDGAVSASPAPTICGERLTRWEPHKYCQRPKGHDYAHSELGLPETSTSAACPKCGGSYKFSVRLADMCGDDWHRDYLAVSASPAASTMPEEREEFDKCQHDETGYLAGIEYCLSCGARREWKWVARGATQGDAPRHRTWTELKAELDAQGDV